MRIAGTDKKKECQCWHLYLPPQNNKVKKLCGNY